MAVESATFVNDFVSTNPLATDPVSQGDDHLRLLKSVLKGTFPNATKAFYFPVTEAKAVDFSIAEPADLNKLYVVDASGATRTASLPAASTTDDGFRVGVMKNDSSANTVIVDAAGSDTVNGAGNFTLTRQYEVVWLRRSGSGAWSVENKRDTGALAVLDSVNTGQITDDAVTLAKLAHGTQGGLIYFAASGVPTELAASTAGFRLKTQGAASNPAWAADIFGGQLLHVRDEKSSGTGGGTFTVGDWRTRTLNTVLTNEISGSSLSSNQITLPAGTYHIYARAPAHIGSDAAASHKAKLYNISDSSDVIIGSSNSINSFNGSDSIIQGRFTIAAEKTFEIRHRASGTITFGSDVAFSVVEVYADVMIWKVA